MGANSMFFYVNFKAIFCLALVATLANFVLTQNLYTSFLDETRDALMSFSSGSSSSKLKLVFPALAPKTRPPVSSRRRRASGGYFGSSRKFFYFNQQVDFHLRLRVIYIAKFVHT